MLRVSISMLSDVTAGFTPCAIGTAWCGGRVSLQCSRSSLAERVHSNSSDALSSATDDGRQCRVVQSEGLTHIEQRDHPTCAN